MMAVDISSSMSALDLSRGKKETTRLQAVQSVFKDFVEGDGELSGRPDDAIGLVSFAGFADTRCPLTFDHGILLKIASSLQIVDERREDGTAMGDGLGLALERLRHSTAKSKIVILLTDGVNNRGEVSPLTAAKLAQSLGIKVYTIGAGTNGLARIRAPDPFSGRMVLQQIEVEIDEETLKGIAEETGGQYFRATDASSLREVYGSIDKLERSRIRELRAVDYSERYQYFVVLGLLMALLGWGLQFTVLRRLP
jgi:Ca-activated chloride channel family protein